MWARVLRAQEPQSTSCMAHTRTKWLLESIGRSLSRASSNRAMQAEYTGRFPGEEAILAALYTLNISRTVNANRLALAENELHYRGAESTVFGNGQHACPNLLDEEMQTPISKAHRRHFVRRVQFQGSAQVLQCRALRPINRETRDTSYAPPIYVARMPANDSDSQGWGDMFCLRLLPWTAWQRIKVLLSFSSLATSHWNRTFWHDVFMSLRADGRPRFVGATLICGIISIHLVNHAGYELWNEGAGLRISVPSLIQNLIIGNTQSTRASSGLCYQAEAEVREVIELEPRRGSRKTGQGLETVFSSTLTIDHLSLSTSRQRKLAGLDSATAVPSILRPSFKQQLSRSWPRKSFVYNTSPLADNSTATHQHVGGAGVRRAESHPSGFRE
nr:hypothetical protein CFP56_24435 [Quercus suber]